MTPTQGHDIKVSANDRTYYVVQVAGGQWSFEVRHRDGGLVAVCQTRSDAAMVARAMSYLLVIEDHLNRGENPVCDSDLFERSLH